MSELIIIAGPQAAGKSTAITNLDLQFRSARALFPQKQVPALMALQESRQIIVHKNMLLGAQFMDVTDEREIPRCDFSRMDKMIAQNHKRLVYVDECNIFTLAHAEAHGIASLRRHWSRYLRYLKQLDAKVIFLDVPPDVSWERRRERYEQRLIYFPESQHQSIMKGYRDYLDRIHPLLHKLYNKLPLPKILLDARVSLKAFNEEFTRAFTDLSVFF